MVSWWSYSTPLWYGTLVEGRRPDLAIIDDSDARRTTASASVADVIDANLGVARCYVIRRPADLAHLAVRYRIEPVGRPAGVYRVTGLVETDPT